MFCSCKKVDVIETSRSNSSIRTMSSIKEHKEEEINLKPRRVPYLLINKPKMVRRDAYGKEISKEKKKHRVTFIDLIDKNKHLVEIINEGEYSAGQIKSNNIITPRRFDKDNNDRVNCKVCIVM